MLLTGHWSGTGPSRLNDYHIEYALTGGVLPPPNITLGAHPTPEQWFELEKAFSIWKNNAFTKPTDYGTWHLNHDPRDQTANVEIGALCMVNATTANWGAHPFTAAHAWMMAGIIARVAALKKLNVNNSFPDNVEPRVLQNGPIYAVSTHAERALQTINDPLPEHPELGYFIYSGDPNCRWDLAVLQPSDVGKLSTRASAVSAAKLSAAWLRQRATELQTDGLHDWWGIDK